MDAKAFQQAFEQSQNQQNNKMTFTPDEAERFKKAFEDPQFRTLFSEYMDELQNPAHREETEAYISQLEGENKVPEGKQLVRPNPGFVVKTKKVNDAGSPDSDKIFINIVSSQLITAPSKEETKDGTHWSLPYSVGPPHQEKDNKNVIVPCFDCCFHPEALELGAKHKKFNELLVKTAMDGVVAAFKRQNQVIKLNDEFHIVKGISYKSGVVATMLIDAAECKQQWNSGSEAQQDNGAKVAANKPAAAPLPPTPPREEQAEDSIDTQEDRKSANSKAAAKKSEPTFKKGFLASKQEKNPPQSKAQPSAVAINAKDDSPLGDIKLPGAPPVNRPVGITEVEGANKVTTIADKENEVIQPKFSLTERGSLGMGDFEAMQSNFVATNRPAELVFKVELPLISSASAVNLDVSEKEINLSCKDLYTLRVSLPYPVFDKKGLAKFDKKTKTLSVTLPVRPHDPKSLTKTFVVSEESHEGVETTTPPAAKSSIINSEATNGTEANTNISVSKLKGAQTHSRWVSNETATDEESKKLKEEITTKVKEVLSGNHVPASVSKPVPASVPEANAKVIADNLDAVNLQFIPSPHFVGSKKGYIFTTKDKGTGYYVDISGKPPQAGGSNSNDSNVDAKAAISQVVDRDVSVEFQKFAFDSRQSMGSITLLVQVAEIILDSVKIAPQESLIDIRFNSRNHQYGMVIELNGHIIPKSTSFDVSQSNLVITAQKKSPGMWEAVAKGTSSASSSQQAMVESNDISTESTKSQELSSTIGSTTSSSIVGNEMERLKESLRSLEFESTSALFELD